jgi:hypothetical protein
MVSEPRLFITLTIARRKALAFGLSILVLVKLFCLSSLCQLLCVVPAFGDAEYRFQFWIVGFKDMCQRGEFLEIYDWTRTQCGR